MPCVFILLLDHDRLLLLCLSQCWLSGGHPPGNLRQEIGNTGFSFIARFCCHCVKASGLVAKRLC
jgi:hypothetical protein